MTALADPEKLRELTVEYADADLRDALGRHIQYVLDLTRERNAARTEVASQATEIAELKEELKKCKTLGKVVGAAYFSSRDELEAKLVAAEAVLQTYADERAPVSTVTRGRKFHDVKVGKLARSYFDKKDSTP